MTFREHIEVLIAAIVGGLFLIAGLWLLMILGQLPDLPEREVSEPTRSQFGQRRD